jgi:hypothetical protein
MKPISAQRAGSSVLEKMKYARLNSSYAMARQTRS